MDGEAEVDAYLDGVATAHLGKLDDNFVALACARLPSAPSRGRRLRVLDVGTGTGAIPIKIARRRADVVIVGLDRSAAMLDKARDAAEGEGLGRRVRFRRADGRRLPWSNGWFDLVCSNSLMHHLADPAPVIDEMARVLRPGGRLLIRDLRRPRPDRIAEHIRRHGRFYRGTMLRLFADSVRAALTVAEMRDCVARTRLGAGRRRRPPVVRPQLETYLIVDA